MIYSLCKTLLGKCQIKWSIMCVTTIQPAGQEHSPVTWWHTPPFWQGQRSSHCCPCLPGGHRSSQLQRDSTGKIMCFTISHIPVYVCVRLLFMQVCACILLFYVYFYDPICMCMWLTMLQYSQGCMCTPLWHGGRWHCFGTDISAGSCYHRCPAHSAPHTASRGSQLYICTHLWWGYTVLHFYTDTGYCSEDPSAYCHMLNGKEKTSRDQFFSVFMKLVSM